MAFHAVVAELVVEIRGKVGNNKLGNNKLGTRKLLPLIKEQLKKRGATLCRDELFDIMDR